MRVIYILTICLISGFLKSQSIATNTYVLKSVYQTVTKIKELPPDSTEVSLHIKEDKMYYAYSGCNSKGGQLVYSAGKMVELSKSGQTKKYCADRSGGNKLMDFEKNYFLLLEKVDRFDEKGDSLFLITTDNFRLAFKKQ